MGKTVQVPGFSPSRDMVRHACFPLRFFALRLISIASFEGKIKLREGKPAFPPPENYQKKGGPQAAWKVSPFN
jgi:hypothetical protein